MAKVKKPGLNEAKARKEIRAILKTVSLVASQALTPLGKLKGGKLYELFALSRLLEHLAGRGFRPRFVGTKIKLKASPGEINYSEPHFVLHKRSDIEADFLIFTDIQVRTLGSALSQMAIGDYSAYHEIDIIVVPTNVGSGKPEYDQLIFGLECKGTASFEKSYVREVLGRRRELSVLQRRRPCSLDNSVLVPADPPSEYWLVYLDPAGNNYHESPRVFGVELKHWQPS